MKRAVKFSERLFTKGGLLKTEPIANSIQKDIVMSLRQKKINNSSGKTEAMEDGDWDTLENQ